MPICRRPTERANGFTLIEMLVVLTILGIAAAIMANALRREPGSFQRKRAAMALQTAILAAERRARSTGETVTVAPAQLVSGAALSGATFDAGDAASLTFFPDGSSNGGVVELRGKPLLSVDWLTGQVVRNE